jgi:hypothetical protein
MAGYRDSYSRREQSRYDRDNGYDDYDNRPRRRYDSGYNQAQDEEHLRILSILYYVLGGLAAFGGLIPLLWVFFGVLMVAGGMGSSGPGGPPVAVMGWIFICVAGFISLIMLSLAGLKLYAGYCLGQRKAYMYCFVIACLTCIHMPLGTLLGVFTIIVLNRPSVKDMFYGGAASPAYGA